VILDKNVWEELALFGPTLINWRHIKTSRQDLLRGGGPWQLIEGVFLTPKKQDIMRLYYWDGLTQEEIGIIFQAKQQVISRHIIEAKKKIWRCIFRVDRGGSKL